MSEHSFCEMLRAAMPYVGTQNEAMVEHLIHTRQLIEGIRNPASIGMREPSDLSACSSDGQETDWVGLLGVIRGFVSVREQRMVDQLLQMFQMLRMFRTLRTVMELKQMMEESGVVPGEGPCEQEGTSAGPFGMNPEMLMSLMQAMGMDGEMGNMPDLSGIMEMLNQVS